MLKRILTALVAICVLIPVLFFSNTIVFPIAVAIVSLISLFEIFKCTGSEKKVALVIPIYLYGVAAPFILRYLDPIRFALISFIVAALYAIYMFAQIIWSHGKKKFADTAAIYFLSIYIIAAMNSIVYIRDFGNEGKYIYLLIFLGAWITDIFAYFTGYFFGKHKLIEDVSPKKTIEGSIGGTVFCAASFGLFGWIIGKFILGRPANIIFLLICGVILSVVAQVGDLIMSVIKRHYGIKDFGKIFPGHGGMLDRFDSILAVSLGLATICMFVTLTGITLL